MSIGQADGRPGADPARPEAAAGDGGRQRDETFAELLRSGDAAAFALLFDAWADPVYDRISHRGFTTLDASRIESDAFVATHRRVQQQGATDPFRVVALRSASQAMAAHEQDRVDLRMPVGPYAEDRLTRSAEVTTLAVDPAVVSFLWESAEVLGHQVREVLDLHYRLRLTPAEVAAVMQETPASVDAILGKVEAGYNAVVRSRIMWRQGRPTHDELAAAVAGHQVFDTSVVKLVAEHLRTCQTCRDASQVPVRPIAVFAAIPIAIAPPGFKEGVVENLTAAGVDMRGSASARRASTAATATSAAEIVGAVEIAAGAAGVAEVAATPGAMGTAEGGRTAAAREEAEESARMDDVPKLPKVLSGKSSRDEDAAAAGRAIGLAAFAGPVDELVETDSAAGAEPAPETEPAYATLAAGAGSTLGGSGGESSWGRSRKGWALAAAAAAVVVVLLAVVVLGGSGSKHPAKLATANSPRSTTSVAPSTVPGATPTTAAPTTTAVAGTPTTAAPATSGSTPTTAKGSSTTVTVKAPSGGGGVTTTTAVPFPNVNLSFQMPTPTITGTWDTNTSIDPHAPRAIWSVTASGPITVAMNGPGLSSTSTSGNVLICPGNLGGAGGTVCTTAAGVYSYTIVVKDSLGRTVRTQTLSLTVT